MADSIVACPGCNKRYSVPPGVPPGQFPCQDCGAVVVYGRSGAATAAAGKAMAASAPKAQEQARAAEKKRAGKKAKGRKSRDDDEEGDDRGRRRAAAAPPQGNPMPMVLGIVAVGVLALIIVIASNRGGKPESSRESASKTSEGGSSVLSAEDLAAAAAAGAATSGAGATPKPATPAAPMGLPPTSHLGGDEPARPEGPTPATAPKRNEPTAAPVGDLAANPPTGGNYGKNVDDLRSMLKESRASVVMPLEHLPDTPPELREAIDKDCALMADPKSGGPGLLAEDRLKKVGRAAIPRILSIAAKMDFSGDGTVELRVDDCCVADSVDRCMREITGYTRYTALQFGPGIKASRYRMVIENWYIWWFSTGYERATYPKKAAAKEDEEL